MNQAIRGTSAQLAGRLMLNGQRLDQPSISFLTRLFDGNGVKRIDTVRTTTGRGGKPAIVWEFDPNQFKLDMKMGRKPRSANDEGETNGNGNGNGNGHTAASGTEGKRRPGRPTKEEQAQRAQAQTNQPQGGGDLAQAIGAAIAQQMGVVVDRLDKLTETIAQPQQASAGEPDTGAEAGKGDEGAQASGGDNGGSNGNETDNGNETAASGKEGSSKETASKPAASKSASASKSGSNKGKGK